MYWYEDEIKRLENSSLKMELEPETIFYGSSSIRMWTSLNTDFAGFKPLNLGFGGSTLAACVWFFDRLMEPYHPKRIVFYAGDNDLGDGRHPEEVFIFFQQLVIEVEKRYGALPCYFVSLKPSIARWGIVDQFKFANNLIETQIIKAHNNWHFVNIFKEMIDANGAPHTSYYGADGLHMTKEGYELWTKVINDAIVANG